MSIPPLSEVLYTGGSSKPPFMQGSSIDAGESSTLPIGDSNSDSEDASNDEMDDLVFTK